MTQFLGIDVGTTFLKGAVLNLDTRRIEQVKRVPAPAFLPGLPPGHYELEPSVVIAKVREIIEFLLPYAPLCEGIVLCTQMHSVVLVDATCTPLTNIITWLDQRSLQAHPHGRTYFEILAARLGQGVRQELGNELRPGLPITTLFWFAERGELPLGATPLTLADFAIAQLCGAPLGVDHTNAAASGALDILTGKWHTGTLAAAGLGQLNMPPVTPFNEPSGVYRGGRRNIPCYRPVGDAQCALAGSSVKPGVLSINISTGSQVTVVREAPLFGNFQTRPFFDGQALTTISGIPAGRALNVLVRLLNELAAAHGSPIDEPWPYLLQAAETVPDSDLRVHLGFFSSAEGGAGAIEGISESNLTAGGLFRAAFHQMATSYEKAAERLLPDRAWPEIVLSGGLAHQSRLLRELIASRFAAPIRLAPTEDTLSGLMALALVCARHVNKVELALISN